MSLSMVGKAEKLFDLGKNGSDPDAFFTKKTLFSIENEAAFFRLW
jgi:hypothetical protein